ncbi:uncharacterized protein LOC135474110 [Liolophura sinensis]|uniref:uncharacterized protein LOC135474110 n=1 Tax=Liolophura sinensis TaxID=3198878 RepID=UPI003159360B
MLEVSNQSPDETPRVSNTWTENVTDSQAHKRTNKRQRHVHFSQSTVVRVIEDPDAFSTKFRAFKRSLVKKCPCLHVEVSPFKEFTTETEFEEKKGDLARFGMPPRKRSSIGEIDLSDLKSQLEKLHRLSEKMIQMAEADDKFHAEELKCVHHFGE